MTDPLALDFQAEAARIESFIRQSVRRLNRRGIVLGVSGGIDSALCCALAARALGPERVTALLMPERGCSEAGTERALELCRVSRVTPMIEEITPTLEAIGCYRQRDNAIRTVFPDWGVGWRHKIVITQKPLEREAIAHFDLVVEDPAGHQERRRMPVEAYLQLVAATNFKQRIRKTVEYFHADRLNHAVIGTPNRLEYELGFFVRGGDGLADLKPIAHLYKTQVYALAAHVGVPESILSQPPSTDTYTLPQSQEEFYFALPYQLADQLLCAMNSGEDAAAAAARLGRTREEIERVFRDFTGKRRQAARFLAEAMTVE